MNAGKARKITDLWPADPSFTFESPRTSHSWDRTVPFSWRHDRSVRVREF